MNSILRFLNEYLGGLFETAPFMPKRTAFLDRADVIYVHAYSDAVIAASFFLIAFLLTYFVKKRYDLPYRWIFTLFAVFIFAAGLTHAAEAWTLWEPAYRLSGLSKAFAAFLSLLTAVLLAPMIPKILSLRSPRELEQANKKLELQIAERRKIEDALRLSEKNSRDLAENNSYLVSVVESSQDAIVGATLDGKIQSWNPAAEKIYGYTAAEAKKMTIRELVPLEGADEHPLILERVTRGEHVQNLEAVRRRKDGSLIHVALTLSPIKDGSGRVTGASSVSRDVSEKKMAEEELRRAYDDLEKRVQQRTAALEDANEILQIEIIERKRAERRLEAQHAVARTLAEAPAIAEASKRILQAIAENLGWDAGIFWLVDEASGSLTSVEAYHSSAREAILRDFVSSVRSESPKPGECLAGRSWAERRPVWSEDVADDPGFTRREDARKVGLRSGFAFPVDADGTVIGVLEFYSHHRRRRDDELYPIFRTIGSQIGQFLKRKRAEENLRSTAEALTRSNRELEQFAHVASHDLQEPLRKIISFSDRLKEADTSSLGENERGYFDRMQNAGLRMKSLIEDLLDFSRVGEKDNPVEIVDLAGVAQEAVADLRHRIPASGAVEIGFLPSVSADAGQMLQLFVNLIGNSLKFTRPGVPARVRVEGSETPGETVIRFSDNGIGFEEKYLDRIFKPFQRLHGRNEYEGTGIGLAICRKIVQRHGGEITAESRPGEGTVFIVRLPRKGGAQ